MGKKLPEQLQRDYEIQCYDLGNISVAALGSSVGYTQLKFKVINYGIIGNVTDRRAGLLYSLPCDLCFLWNLWGSRKFLSLSPSYGCAFLGSLRGGPPSVGRAFLGGLRGGAPSVGCAFPAA